MSGNVIRLLFSPLLTALLLSVAVPSAGHAQKETEKKSAGAIKLTQRNADAIQRALHEALPSRKHRLATLPEKRLAPLTQAELAPDATALAAQAGVHRALDADLAQFARWDVAPNGQRVWRLRLHSPQAAGLRLHFRDFHVGNGRVWLHDGSGEPAGIMGPYTGDGVFQDGEFWSDFVLADTLVIEYEPETAPATMTDAPPFTLVKLSHLLPGVLAPSPTATEGGSPANPPQAKTGAEPNAAAASPVAAAANCHLDVSCHPEWAETARSVGHIVYESQGRSYVCSGTLLATRNRSGTPYFLTADHCINGEDSARSMQVFWMYQSSQCDGPPADRRQVPRTLGARYLVSGALGTGDYALVQLTSLPDNASFSGWTTEEPPEGTRLTGIHHPSGDYKRISFGERVARRPGLAGANLDYYYNIGVSQGRTEGGSSGSGLFVRPNVLVGTLTWGPKVDQQSEICTRSPFYTGYGRLTTHYSFIRDYLEGRTTNPGGTTPPPAGGGQQGIDLTSGQATNIALDAVPSPTLFSGQNAYRIRVPEGATRLEIRLGVSGRAGFVVKADDAPTVQGGRAVGDYTSVAYTGQETLVITPTTTPPLRAGTYYIALAVFETSQRVTGTLTATVTAGGGGGGTTPPPTGGSNNLTSGVPASFRFAAVNASTLANGDAGFRIQVPQGATRLEIRLSGSPASADLDLYARFGTDVTVENRRVVADHLSEGAAGEESLVITSSSNPPLRAGTYYIGIGIFTTGTATQGTVVATVTGGGTTPPTQPPGGTNVLASGVPASFRFAAVSQTTLVNGDAGYRIQVPQGATRLEIRLNGTPASADIDLYARFGTDVTVENRRVIADHLSEGAAGEESLVITSTSSPPLRAGTYYIGIGIFATGTAIQGTVVATVTGGSTTPPTQPPPTQPPPTQPPPTSGTTLVPGRATQFDLPASSLPTLFTGPQGFAVQVPQGATRLEVRLQTTPRQVDVDLLVRHNAPPSATSGRLESDHNSSGPDGQEVVTITTESNPPLRAGTYYIGLAMFTKNTAAQGVLTATVTTGGGGGGNPGGGGDRRLVSGRAVEVAVPAVDGGTLLTGENVYTVDVPAGATRLTLQLNTADAGVDVDLFVRAGEPPRVMNGRVQADHSSTGPAGTETITITPASSPPLRPGTYHIALAVYTPGRATRATLRADLAASGDPPPGGGGGTGGAAGQLRSGAPASFSFAAVESPALFRGQSGFFIDVPQNASRLDVRLTTATTGADVDLFLRQGQDVGLEGGRVVADHRAEGPTGAETLTVTAATPTRLRPGRYYIALGVFTTGVPVTGTVTATVTTDAPRPTTSTQLSPGVPAKFSLPAVSQSTLLVGEFGFTVTVPEGSSGMRVQLATETPDVDVDLYLRHERDVELRDGQAVADHGSEGPVGAEEILVDGNTTPPLRPGTYYIAFALYNSGVEVTGSLTATLVRDSLVPPLSAARALESGAPARYELPGRDGATLFQGEYAYRITVPPGTGRLTLSLRGDEPGVDVDLFARFGQEAAVENGRVVTDHAGASDTGIEEVVIDRPRPGVYFINLALFTTGRSASGTLTATLSRDGAQSQEEWRKLSALDKQDTATQAAADPDDVLARKPGAWAVEPLAAEAKGVAVQRQSHKAVRSGAVGLLNGPGKPPLRRMGREQ